jgi:DNA-binding NarL/FixJ family response regulator
MVLASSNNRPRVLIADDHPGVLATLCRVLNLECDVVGTVGDGAALLDSVAQLAPDVVLVDLNMPGLSGLDVSRQLTQSNPGVRVIVLSGADDAEIAERALAAGASAFFVKHRFRTEDLLAAVRAPVGE